MNELKIVVDKAPGRIYNAWSVALKYDERTIAKLGDWVPNEEIANNMARDFREAFAAMLFEKAEGYVYCRTHGMMSCADPRLQEDNCEIVSLYVRIG